MSLAACSTLPDLGASQRSVFCFPSLRAFTLVLYRSQIQRIAPCTTAHPRHIASTDSPYQRPAHTVRPNSLMLHEAITTPCHDQVTNASAAQVNVCESWSPISASYGLCVCSLAGAMAKIPVEFCCSSIATFFQEVGCAGPTDPSKVARVRFSSCFVLPDLLGFSTRSLHLIILLLHKCSFCSIVCGDS